MMSLIIQMPNQDMEVDWEKRRVFRFCAGRLKAIFFIASKAVASFYQPLMPVVVQMKKIGESWGRP
jgi:hypothetical protein